MSLFENLTWKCNVCGDERPDAQISVFVHDLSAENHLPAGTFCYNLRFCNDRADCIEKAKIKPKLHKWDNDFKPGWMLEDE
jgi:hypothetical protein